MAGIELPPLPSAAPARSERSDQPDAYDSPYATLERARPSSERFDVKKRSKAYSTDTDRYLPKQWPVGMRRDMQRLLAEAGLIEGEYSEGVWDDETMAAYKIAIDIAAENGRPVQEMLRQLANATFVDPKTGARRKGARGKTDETSFSYRDAFVPDVYRAPDPATLTALTRQSISQLLGRNPSSDEIAAVQGDLAGWFREAYDAELVSLRTRHEMQQDERLRGENAVAAAEGHGNVVLGGPTSSGIAPGTPGPPALEAEDIRNRLDEKLTEKYKSEIGRKSQREVTGRTGEVATGAVGSLSAAIFGAANRGNI